jgi:putative transposase
MEINSERHQRRIIRMQSYDYSFPGGYFITICTHKHLNKFGKIIKNKIILNEIGETVYNFWFELPNHFLEVELDEFVVMPNHIHRIIFINDKCRGEVPSPKTRKGGETPPLHTLGQIVAFYKYQTTKLINKIRNKLGLSLWQRNYYDRIIRNDDELNRIREYIVNNPLKWAFDHENLEGKPNDEEIKFWEVFK